MKKHILRRDFFVEIRRNRSRFISILAIVTLGVAFLPACVRRVRI
jgi:hypothetical protein